MFSSKDSRGRSSIGSGALTLTAVAAALALLGACVAQDPPPANLDASFRNAVRQNIAVQTINPDAAGPDESQVIDGQSAERALEAQRTRSTQAPPESLIINVGSGGS